MKIPNDFFILQQGVEDWWSIPFCVMGTGFLCFIAFDGGPIEELKNTLPIVICTTGAWLSYEYKKIQPLALLLPTIIGLIVHILVSLFVSYSSQREFTDILFLSFERQDGQIQLLLWVPILFSVACLLGIVKYVSIYSFLAVKAFLRRLIK